MKTVRMTAPSIMPSPRVAIVVPVYNHAHLLRPVVIAALRVSSCVLVVDDGSTDGVAEALAGLEVRLLRHAVNKGKGAAIMTGVTEAERLGMTHVVTIDGDGQHDPDDFRAFLPEIEKAPNAILVGVRDFDETTPWLSRFGRGFSNFWLRLQTGCAAHDAQSGFRAYPIAFLRRLKLRETGYPFEVEVLVKAAWAGIPLKEVAVTVFYPPPGERVSHFSLFLDNLRLAWLNTRLTTRALLPFPHSRITTLASRGAFAPRGVEGENGEINVFHPLRSLTRLLRENMLPRPLALAGILGVFLGALPLIACHTIVILGAASFLRLNKVTALSASQICMPPLVPALCIETGYFLRHGSLLTEVSLRTLGYQGLERFYEWLLGSLIVGPALGLVIGSAIYIMAVVLRWGMNGSRR
jgi:glycosyltransferase involved in cell wall biosynthesis